MDELRNSLQNPKFTFSPSFQAAAEVLEDPSYSDPLSDCPAEFDIIRFIGENDGILDSPADPSQFQSQRMQGRAASGMFDPRSEMMYQNPTRLPYSPPITDVSAAGSSGSPSSASDSPFSPDNYPNYHGMNVNQQNGNGLILGINPNLAAQMVAPNEMMNQKQRPNNRMLQQALLSPDGDYRSNTYTPQPQSAAALSQISPSPANVRQGNGNFMFQNNGYQADTYNGVMTTITNDGTLDSRSSRKRMRIETATPQVKDEAQKIYTLPSQLMLASPMPADEFDEGFHQRAIRFSRFMEDGWVPIYDGNHRLLPQFETQVVADKGFNYSSTENCFVNQKKNHFQITTHIEPVEVHPPWYVKVGDRLLPVREFSLVLRGVKSEMPTSEIDIKQSTTDRKPTKLEAVVIAFQDRRPTKATVSRLHFEKTTMNNQRKNGRSNPDQKYFLLIVKLLARTDSGEEFVIQAYQSEKVIVRASNPGQFESPDADATWQKNGSTLYYNNGYVAIGVDKALGPGPLSVGGDIYYAGVLHRPSDRRVKEEIHEIDTKGALSRLEKIRVVEYAYKPEIANEWGLNEESRHRVGVIAQELATVLPDAVTDTGDLLQVDDSRIFYETVAAATELSKLTGSLETKITAVEKLSHKLARLHKQRCKERGSIASGLTEFGISDKSASASRVSLTSTAPSCMSRASTLTRGRDEDDRERHYYCRNPACHKSDPPLCSAKITQLTTIVLVVVMTICLIAMSTLYVLDWHRRTFGHSLYREDLSSTTMSPTMDMFDWNSTSTEDGDEEVGRSIDGRNFANPAYSDGPPLTATCGHDHCQTYCCYDPQKFDGPKPEEEVEKTNAEPKMPTQQRQYLANNRILKPLPKIRPSLPSGINIELLTLNVTLDERYCLKGSCNSRRGIYALFVPISPYLPTMPLELKISAAGSGNYIANCGARSPKLCTFNDNFILSDIDEEPVSRKLTEEVYELPIGNYVHITYRFRIGHSTESCNMNDAQRGRSFDEYNLIFYRPCAMPPGPAPAYW